MKLLYDLFRCKSEIRKGLYLLAFAIGIVSYAAPLPEIKIEGSDAIKTYVANAASLEKKQMHKLLEAGDKFAKLFVAGKICGCEPQVECPVVVALTEYPVVDDFLSNFCKGWDATWVNNQRGFNHYLVDTDTHLVFIDIDPNAHKAVLTYDSSLVGIFVEGENRNDNEDLIVSWDISNRGKPISVSFTFNTNTNKIIDYSKGSANVGYYTQSIWYPESMLGRAAFLNWSEEHRKRQKDLANQIKADLLNYQKTHKY